MILFKNNLIFGIIKAILVVCFKIVYKVLSLFCMQGVFLLAILGLILYLTGVFTSYPIALMVYYIVLACTAIISLCFLIRKIFHLNKRN